MYCVHTCSYSCVCVGSFPDDGANLRARCKLLQSRVPVQVRKFSTGVRIRGPKARSRVGRVAASAAPLTETLLAKLASTRRTPRLRAATLPRHRRHRQRQLQLWQTPAPRTPHASHRFSIPVTFAAPRAETSRARRASTAPTQPMLAATRQTPRRAPLPPASTLIQVARCGMQVWFMPACWLFWALYLYIHVFM
jgi:hypothetical protein